MQIGLFVYPPPPSLNSCQGELHVAQQEFLSETTFHGNVPLLLFLPSLFFVVEMTIGDCARIVLRHLV